MKDAFLASLQFSGRALVNAGSINGTGIGAGLVVASERVGVVGQACEPRTAKARSD